MDHRVTFSFEYETESRAAVVAASVRPEVEDLVDERSRATVDRSGPVVELVVEAADLVALRAAANTFLSLVGVAETVSGLTA